MGWIAWTEFYWMSCINYRQFEASKVVCSLWNKWFWNPYHAKNRHTHKWTERRHKNPHLSNGFDPIISTFELINITSQIKLQYALGIKMSDFCLIQTSKNCNYLRIHFLRTSQKWVLFLQGALLKMSLCKDFSSHSFKKNYKNRKNALTRIHRVDLVRRGRRGRCGALRSTHPGRPRLRPRPGHRPWAPSGARGSAPYYRPSLRPQSARASGSRDPARASLWQALWRHFRRVLLHSPNL